MSEQGPASQPLRVGRKISHTPFPTREELMKRNSFPGPDKNKYLNRMWGGGVKNEKVNCRCRTR